jgi:hypothetical protein
MSLTVGTDAHDGDLRQCLSKCHELIIKHCIGKLGMTTLSDLVDLATEADYAENLKKTSWKLRTSWKLTYPNISFDEFMTAADEKAYPWAKPLKPPSKTLRWSGP